MQVTINEEHIPEDFSHMRNLEEALVELNDRFVPQGQQLFQVRVNGEFFSEPYPRESKYMELKEISTLDLKTIPDGDMARVILGGSGGAGGDPVPGHRKKRPAFQGVGRG